MKPIALLLVALATSALAADPTRPPDAWLAPQPAADGQAADSGLRLQSVLIPLHGRPVAVIGNRTVTLGGMLGEQRLVRLTEREAVLQGADGVTHLYLTPDVDKRPVVLPKSRKPGQLKDSP